MLTMLRRGMVVALLALLLSPAGAWAQVTPTLLTEGEQAGNAGNGTTSSVALDADALGLVVVTGRDDDAPDNAPCVVTGHSLTWDQVPAATIGGDPNRFVAVYRAMGGGTSGTIGINCEDDMLAITWAVIEVTGVATGSNGADAFEEVVASGGVANVAQPSCTITGTPATGDFTFAALMVEDSQTWDEGAGWETLTEFLGTPLETAHGIYHDAAQDQTFTASNYAVAAARDWGVICGILRAPGGGGGAPAISRTGGLLRGAGN